MFLARGEVPAGRREVHPDRSWPAGALARMSWGPCLELVRASEVVGAGCPVWQAQSESAHEEWGPGWVGVSTGSSWPRPNPTAGTMGRIEAVEEDGTPFESN